MITNSVKENSSDESFHSQKVIIDQAHLHNVSQDHEIMLVDRSAKQRAGYTSDRKHFLEQSVCDCRRL